jgi:hypothetical protein
VSSEQTETIKAQLEAGKTAFERGEYRKAVECLEAANTQAESQTQLGGEIQIWLVTAYEALGLRSQALDLCRQVSRHPDYQTRKQGNRLLYILEAPRLVTRPEWLTQIPDLASLPDSKTGERQNAGAGSVSSTSEPKKPVFQLEPADLSQVNTQDRWFIWVALGLTVLVLGGVLLWA